MYVERWIDVCVEGGLKGVCVKGGLMCVLKGVVREDL